MVPINWHLKAEEVAYILADSGADILVCHADLLPQISDGLPSDLRLLVVATPPEIAAAFNVAPALTHVPDGMTDWDIWRDSHAPSQEPPVGSVADVLYLGHHRPPKGVRRKPMRPEQLAAAERVGAIAYGVKPNEDQVVLMNGPMYHSAPNSYGMLAFRHGCTIVLEPRFDPEDHAAADRAPPRHPHAHGADHVRAAAAAAGRGEDAATTCRRCASSSTARRPARRRSSAR